MQSRSRFQNETEPEPDEAEPDSENEDVRGEPEVGFDDHEDDWEQIEKENGSQSQPKPGDHEKVGVVTARRQESVDSY